MGSFLLPCGNLITYHPAGRTIYNEGTGIECAPPTKYGLRAVLRTVGRSGDDDADLKY